MLFRWDAASVNVAIIAACAKVFPTLALAFLMFSKIIAA